MSEENLKLHGEKEEGKRLKRSEKEGFAGNRCNERAREVVELPET